MQPSKRQIKPICFYAFAFFVITLLLVPVAVNAVKFNVMATVKVNLQGDVNGDCRVNIIDFVYVILSYGSEPGDRNWNPDADLNQDNRVNIFDLAMVGRNYGDRCQ